MGKRTTVDPKTGKALPKGISLHEGKYQARKTVPGLGRQSATFKNKSDAEDWIKAWEARIILKQITGNFFDLGDVTVGDLVRRYKEEEINKKKSAWDGHYKDILTSSLAKIKLKDMRNIYVTQWRDKLLKKKIGELENGDAKYLAPATVVKKQNLLAAIFNHAVSEWGYEIPNWASAKSVKRPPGADEKRTRRLEHGEYKKLLKATRGTDMYWLIRWSVRQGTRLSEALSLRWRDINYDKYEFSLYKTKSDRFRKEKGPERRPLTFHAKLVLDLKLASLPTPPAPTEHIFDLSSANAVSMSFSRMARDVLGFNPEIAEEKFIFHDLRHEATSRIALMIENPLELMRFTGHRTLSSLNRYYQPESIELARKTMREMSKREREERMIRE